MGTKIDKEKIKEALRDANEYGVVVNNTPFDDTQLSDSDYQKYLNYKGTLYQYIMPDNQKYNEDGSLNVENVKQYNPNNNEFEDNIFNDHFGSIYKTYDGCTRTIGNLSSNILPQFGMTPLRSFGEGVFNEGDIHIPSNKDQFNAPSIDAWEYPKMGQVLNKAYPEKYSLLNGVEYFGNEDWWSQNVPVGSYVFMGDANGPRGYVGPNMGRGIEYTYDGTVPNRHTGMIVDYDNNGYPILADNQSHRGNNLLFRPLFDRLNASFYDLDNSHIMFDNENNRWTGKRLADKRNSISSSYDNYSPGSYEYDEGSWFGLIPDMLDLSSYTNYNFASQLKNIGMFYGISSGNMDAIIKRVLAIGAQESSFHNQGDWSWRQKGKESASGKGEAGNRYAEGRKNMKNDWLAQKFDDMNGKHDDDEVYDTKTMFEHEIDILKELEDNGKLEYDSNNKLTEKSIKKVNKILSDKKKEWEKENKNDNFGKLKQKSLQDKSMSIGDFQVKEPSSYYRATTDNNNIDDMYYKPWMASAKDTRGNPQVNEYLLRNSYPDDIDIESDADDMVFGLTKFLDNYMSIKRSLYNTEYEDLNEGEILDLATVAHNSGTKINSKNIIPFIKYYIKGGMPDDYMNKIHGQENRIRKKGEEFRNLLDEIPVKSDDGEYYDEDEDYRSKMHSGASF